MQFIRHFFFFPFGIRLESVRAWPGPFWSCADELKSNQISAVTAPNRMAKINVLIHVWGFRNRVKSYIRRSEGNNDNAGDSCCRCSKKTQQQHKLKMLMSVTVTVSYPYVENCHELNVYNSAAGLQAPRMHTKQTEYAWTRSRMWTYGSYAMDFGNIGVLLVNGHLFFILLNFLINSLKSYAAMQAFFFS